MTEGGDPQIRPKTGGGIDKEMDEFLERFNAEGHKGTAALAALLAEGKTAREILDGLAKPVPEHVTHWLEPADNASRSVAVLNLVATVGQPFELAVGTGSQEVRLILANELVTIEVDN